MSVIGPRPGLWNQDILTAERDKYNANDVKPGLAHADVGNVDDATKEKYYAVNTDLAVEVCEKAKREGAKEFIFICYYIVHM